MARVTGDLKVGAAPAGARLEVVTPRGEVAGYSTMGNAGQCGFVVVYGEVASENPVIPGFRAGEPIAVL